MGTPINRQKFETLCSLTVEYVRACVQASPPGTDGSVLTEAQLNACFELARQTVDLFEKEFHAAQQAETNQTLH